MGQRDHLGAEGSGLGGTHKQARKGWRPGQKVTVPPLAVWQSLSTGKRGAQIRHPTKCLTGRKSRKLTLCTRAHALLLPHQGAG